MNTRTSSVLFAPQFPLLLQQFITAAARWRLLFVLLGVLQFAIAVQAQVTNPPLCTYVFFPSNGIHSAESGFGLVTVTTSPGCPWSAFTTNSWIHPDSSATNFGSGSMTYFIDANESALQRIGLIRIGNRNFQVRQAGNSNPPPACTYALSPPSAYHGTGESTDAVEVVTSLNCFWLATTTNEWISVLSSPTNFGSGLVIYRVAANPGVNRSGFIHIDGQNFLVAQAGNTNPPVVCTYSLFPSNAIHGAGSSTGLVTVTTAPGCPWVPITTNSWIHLDFSYTNVGSGTVGYTIDANESTSQRIGLIRIDGRNFQVRQVGNTNTPVCTYAISPVEAAYSANPGTGSVSVVTAAGCPWGISTTNEWIHTASSLTNVGSGTVNYFIDANLSTTARVGFIRIDGQSFMITQAGDVIPPECQITLTPTTRTHPWMVSTGTVAVATGSNCFWFARTTNSWITILPPATNFGSRTLSYRVTSNTGNATRFGSIQIDGKFLTVIQFANTNGPGTNACTYALSPASRSHGAGVSTNVVEVDTSSNCFWLATTTNEWINVLSSPTNFGSGLVVYRLAANPGPGRAGAIRIDGQNFLVTQSGTTNTPGSNLPPVVRMILPLDGASFATPVTLGFAADAQDSDGSVVSVEFFANGESIGQGVRSTTGAPWQVNQWYFSWSNVPPAEYNFTARATDNRGLAGFSPSVHVRVYSTNPPPACTFTLLPPNRAHTAGVSTGIVSVVTSSDCFWLARSTNSWITILSPTTNFGQGSVFYRLAANPGSTRAGAIRIDGQNFLITQLGTTNTPSTLVNLGTVVVSNITHEFLNQQLPDRPWMPSVVVDYLIDQSHDTGPGASLPSVSVNWNTKTQFVLRVTAPPGRKFLVRVPEGNSASFGGLLWWESTGAGATRPGTVAVTLEGLEGPSPDFSDSLSMVSDSHGFFGFVDVSSSYFSGRLAFTGINLVGTVPPQATENGIQDFTPHINSSLVVFYSTPETNDPGRFVSIVPTAPVLVTPPSPGSCPVISLHEPEGRTLVVECSEDMVHWRPISTNVAPCKVFDWGGTDSPRRFYRAVELP